MLSVEQQKQFSEILEELGKTLDISETQYKAAVESYQAVGNHLSREDSELAPYDPEILPQGSFMLGTMIQPINENDDLDIDLVCQLKGKHPSWTQYNVKQKVGDRLKADKTYEDMLDKEGRRCWTLLYRRESNNTREKYHMDILPSIVDSGYRMVLEKAFSTRKLEDINQLTIRITDKQENSYYDEQDHKKWMKSNPFGYGTWFYNQAAIDEIRKAFLLTESVKPVPAYQEEKLPLQRVVQILKRHRDMMFNGDEDMPISIIITTLVARAYNKETNIIEALMNVVAKMPHYIEERWSEKHGKWIKWIPNPVTDDENFADKWPDDPKKQDNFYKWLNQVKEDINNAIGKRGLQNIQEALENPFGEDVITKVFSSYGNKLLKQRESDAMKMAAGTGILSNAGRTTVRQHKPYGRNE